MVVLLRQNNYYIKFTNLYGIQTIWRQKKPCIFYCIHTVKRKLHKSVAMQTEKDAREGVFFCLRIIEDFARLYEKNKTKIELNFIEIYDTIKEQNCERTFVCD